MTDDLGNTLYKRGYFPNAGRNPGAGNSDLNVHSGNAGYGPGYGSLSPEQNPAYQAAIMRPRSGLIMVNSPNGGSMGVSAGQLQGYLAKGYTQSVPQVSKYDQLMTQSLVAQNRAYGESPASNSKGQLANMQNGQSLGGNYMAQNGVFNPSVPNQPGFLSNLASGLGLSKPYQGFQNLTTGFGAVFPAIAKILESGAATKYGQNVSTGQLGAQPIAQPAASQQSLDLYASNPSTATQPRRWFDPGHNYGF